MNEKKPGPKRRSKKAPRAAAPTGERSRWNPETDDLIVAPFSAARPAGKARCKRALQAELGLKARSRTPLVVYVGALDAADGCDLVLAALPALRKVAAQIVLLAPARGPLAAAAAAAVAEQGERALLLVEDDEALLRRLLAGADLVLVPAAHAGADAVAWRGLRYGALPVAFAGSGVARLLPSASERRRVASEAPGFFFRSATGAALARAVLKAFEAYDDAVRWRRLRRAGMLVQELPGSPAATPPVPAAAGAAAHRQAPPVMTLAEIATRGPATAAGAAVPATVAAPAPVEPAAEPYVDWGPPPPARYGEDALALLVQSPRRLYGYWEVASRAPAGLRLVLHEDRGERELSAAAGDLGEWWIDGEPGHAYQLELRAPDGRALLRSERVRTPRETSSEHDEAEFVERRIAGRQRGSAVASGGAESRAAGGARTRPAAARGRAVSAPASAGRGAPVAPAELPEEATSRRAAPVVLRRRSAAGPATALGERRAPASEEGPQRGREQEGRARRRREGGDAPGSSEHSGRRGR